MRNIRFLLSYGAMLLFAAWCLYCLRGDLAQLSLAPILGAWDLVFLAALLSLLNYMLRIVRWRAYLRHLGHRIPLRFTALTFIAGFAYTVSPGKVGEMARARYYVPLGVPVSDVVAAFCCERLLDVVAMVALCLLLFTASSHYGGTVLAIAAGTALLLVALATTPWSDLAVALKSTARIPSSLRQLLIKVATALAGTRALLRPDILVMGFVIGLMAWTLEGVGLGVLSSMFPAVHLHLPNAAGIYAIAVLIGGVSFLPGGLGSTEAVMTALLATQGYSVGQALIITLTCRLVTLWLAVLLGWGAIFVLRQQQTGPVVVPWQQQ